MTADSERPVNGSGAVIKGVAIGPSYPLPDTLLHLKSVLDRGPEECAGEFPASSSEAVSPKYMERS